MSWNPFSSKPAKEEPKYDSSSELIEDPYADPFAEDDDGGSFGSTLQLPPVPEPIQERPSAGRDSDAPRRINIDYGQLLGANPTAQSAVSGLAPKKKPSKEAAYLKFARRGVYERAMYNTGCAYLGGAGWARRASF